MKHKLVYFVPIAVFLLFVFAAGVFILSGKNPSVIQSPLVGKPVPAFAIEGLASTDITGPALINFFASWCAPCEAEHPVIKALAQDFRIYGISYKDSIENRDRFLARLGNPYIETGNDPDGIAAIAFGIYGVPSTFVIDAKGVIVYRHDAPLTEDDVEALKEYVND